MSTTSSAVLPGVTSTGGTGRSTTRDSGSALMRTFPIVPPERRAHHSHSVLTSPHNLERVEADVDAPPSANDILAIAHALGLELGPDEIAAYRDRVSAKLEQIEEFLGIDWGEDRPPLLAPVRDQGRRPTEAEDPYNAWYRRCEILATASGPLAGKT